MGDEQEFEPDISDFVSGADCRRCGSPAHCNPHECDVCADEWSDAAQRLANYYKEQNYGNTENIQ